MNVTFLKDHKMGSNSFREGQKATLITSLAEELVKEGICEENNSVTLRDTIIASKVEENKEEETSETPEESTEEPSEQKPTPRRRRSR